MPGFGDEPGCRGGGCGDCGRDRSGVTLGRTSSDEVADAPDRRGKGTGGACFFFTSGDPASSAPELGNEWDARASE